MNYKKKSEQFSLWSSILIGVLSYIPYYQSKITQITCFISLTKSFNLINCSMTEYIHHVFNAILCVLFLLGNRLVQKHDIYFYNIMIQTNISTIFLILNYEHKQNIFKILFVLSFVYYRFKFIYYYTNSLQGIKVICMNHVIVNDNTCYQLFNISYIGLCFLNIYWIFLITKKFFDKIKKPIE